jgi:poly(3-hydroxybutyrate) depolymerase
MRERLAELRYDRRAGLAAAVLAIAAGALLGVFGARALGGTHAAAAAAAITTTASAPPAPPPTVTVQVTVGVKVVVKVEVRRITLPAPTPATPKPAPPTGGLPFATLPLAARTPAGAVQVLRELQKLPRTRMQAFEYTTHAGTDRRVVVLSPKHPGDGPLPLVLALHGRGGDPAHTCGPWGDLPGYAHVIVACPQGQGDVLERYSWGAPGQIDDLARMPALVQGALPGLRVDPHRIYAVGASMGGMETLLLVARHPDLLRAAVAIDPVTDLAARYYALRSSDTGLVADARMRLEIGGSPDLAPAAFQERSPAGYVDELARADTAIAIWWSTRDQEVPDQATEQAGPFAERLGRDNPRRAVWERVGTWSHSWPYRHELWQTLRFFRLIPATGLPVPRGKTTELAPGWTAKAEQEPPTVG